MTSEDYSKAILRVEDSLMGFAMGLTNRNIDDAKDLVQDTFLKAIKYQSRYKDETNLKAWLFTICKNSFISKYRHEKQWTAFVDKTPDLYYLDKGGQALAAEDPESVCMHKELHEMVAQVLPLFGDPFRMHTEGYQYNEIAEKLDETIGTVKSRIFQARKRVKDMIETGKGFKVKLETKFVKSNTFEPMEAEVIRFRTVVNGLIKHCGWNKNKCVIESKISWPTFQQLMDEKQEHKYKESVVDRMRSFDVAHYYEATNVEGKKADLNEIQKHRPSVGRYGKIPKKKITDIQRAEAIADVEKHPLKEIAQIDKLTDLTWNKAQDLLKNEFGVKSSEEHLKYPKKEGTKDRPIHLPDFPEVFNNADKIAAEVMKHDAEQEVIRPYIKKLTFWELVGLALERVPEGISVDVHYKKEK
jgi:RNA polymerase sigma-70 factor (ECF subfamily)